MKGKWLKGIAAVAPALLFSWAGLFHVALAQDPYYITPVKTLDGTGGDSVSGSGRWSVVVDETSCNVHIYELDYGTMQWVDAPGSPFTNILPDTCSVGEFGAAASLAGNVLVIGVPGWCWPLSPICIADEIGGIALFIYDSGTWERSTGMNSTGGYIQISPEAASNPAGAAGSRYGQSVSITQNPQTPNQYIIAVGAPGVNGIGGQGTGAVYTYFFNASPSNPLDNPQEYQGAEAGDELGYAVTTQWPFVLVGAPGHDFDKGEAYVLNTQIFPSFVQRIQATSSDRFGSEVSLSPDLANTTAAPPLALFGSNNDGYAFRYDAGSSSYVEVPKGFLSYGGDVSQSGGVSVFGDNNVNHEGAVIYRDPVEDDVPGDGIDLLLENDFPGDFLDNAGEDIRLVNEFLWFANADEDRAIVYEFPCGYGYHLKAYEYALVSLPCNVSLNQTVGQIFGHLGTIGDKTDIRIYAYDFANPAKPRPTIELTDPGAALGDVLAFNAWEYAFWVITDEDQYFAVPQAQGYTPRVDVSNYPNIANQEPGIRQVVPIQLPQPVDDGNGNVFARAMVANPIPRHFSWYELYFAETPGGTPHKLNSTSLIDSTIYVYDVTAGGGQPYRAIDPTVPGFAEDLIKPYQGFWIKTNAGVGSHSQLYLPLVE